MKDIGYIAIYALVILLLVGCSNKFDSFDPTTSTLRWIITSDKKWNGIKNLYTQRAVDL